MEVRLLLLLAAAGLAMGPPGAASYAYNKVYLDDPSVCNGTIRLDDTVPAVLVRLSPGRLYRPLTCSVQIEIANSPIAGGLSAVVQELSVGKFDDPNNCTSYLKVTTFGSSHQYTKRLCGEWRSGVHHLEVRKSLFGACDTAMDGKYGYECTVRAINLQAHVPRVAINLRPAFEVVVSAYYNRDLFIGSCSGDRFMCQNRDAPEQPKRCISSRLVCDNYPNCGFVDNQDEYVSTCSRRTSTMTESDHFFATWAGFAVIVLLLVVAVSYFIRSVRWTTAREPADLHGRAARQPPPPRPGVPEPPPYEALYPQGPPSGFLEKKRERAGAEEDAAPTPLRPATPRREQAPQRHVLHGSARGAPGAAVTHIYVEPEEDAPEEPPPYTERPALRHSVLLAEAVP